MSTHNPYFRRGFIGKIEQAEENPNADTIEFGEHRFHFGEEIVELADSTTLLNNLGALHRKMREDGYLFIQGFHPRGHAKEASRWIL